MRAAPSNCISSPILSEVEGHSPPPEWPKPRQSKRGSPARYHSTNAKTKQPGLWVRYRTCNARTLKNILYPLLPHRSMNSDPLTTAVMVKESMLKPLETTHSQMNCTPWPNPSPDPSPELLIEMSKNVTFNPGVGGDENSFPSINPDVVLSRSISPIWLCACMVLSTFTAPPRRERECLVVQALFNRLTP